MPTRTVIKQARNNRGFTIVEVLVAIVIMAIGVLGLAGTAASVSRLIGGGAQQTIAANVAISRFEQMRSTTCASVTSGTATTRGMTEHWHVKSIAASVDSVTDSVTYTAAGGRKPSPLVFTSYVKC
ncbi:MAG TPA: prepilin-type N-terminal cleavage/methylation domain-containing protein [Gemmatimonadaceae bacterium]|nr:prepilin-type N-terminal cleavage/methylation domain-containing protein [Gemmatimonadaceae bacterium]